MKVMLVTERETTEGPAYMPLSHPHSIAAGNELHYYPARLKHAAIQLKSHECRSNSNRHD